MADGGGNKPKSGGGGGGGGGKGNNKGGALATQQTSLASLLTAQNKGKFALELSKIKERSKNLARKAILERKDAAHFYGAPIAGFVVGAAEALLEQKSDFYTTLKNQDVIDGNGERKRSEARAAAVKGSFALGLGLGVTALGEAVDSDWTRGMAAGTLAVASANFGEAVVKAFTDKTSVIKPKKIPPPKGGNPGAGLDGDDIEGDVVDQMGGGN